MHKNMLSHVHNRIMLISLILLNIVIPLRSFAADSSKLASDDYCHNASDVFIPLGVNGRISGIYCAYANRGSNPASIFGKVIGPELKFSDGSSAPAERLNDRGTLIKTYQIFENGIIFNNREEGTAFALFNDILFTEKSGPSFFGSTYWDVHDQLGFPISSQIGTGSNCRAYFERGYISCNGELEMWGSAGEAMKRFAPDRIYHDIPSLKMPHENNVKYNSGPHNFERSGTEYIKVKVSKGTGSGIDIGTTSRKSSEVLAVTSGTIIDSGCNKTFGCNIAIRSDFSGIVIVYGHVIPLTKANKYGKSIKQGIWIQQGESIGNTALVGSTNGYHVHLELRDGSKSEPKCNEKLNANLAICKWGNPIGWDGIIIDGYMITEFGDKQDSSKIFNYDGGAVIVNNDPTKKYTSPPTDSFKQIDCNFDEGNTHTWVSNNTFLTDVKCSQVDTNDERVVFAEGKVESTNVPPTPTPTIPDEKAIPSYANEEVAVLHSTNRTTAAPSRDYRPYPGGSGSEPNTIPIILDTPSPFEHCDPSQPGVVLYAERNYGGRCTRILNDEPDLSKFNIDNSVSSIWINGDYTVKLYKDKYYGEQTGTSHLRDEFSKSDDNIDDKSLGEQWSSIKIEKKRQKSDCGNGNRDGVYFYKDKNYKGTCYYTTSDIRDFGTISVGNNETSSMRIVGDWQVTLYKSQDFRESSKTYTSDKGNLDEKPEIGNNISSARVERLPAACRAPTLLQPTNGTTAGQRTLTFTWAGVVCVRANGTDSYRLRIKTVSVMDSGGEVVFDETATGTSRTITLDSRWERRPLYWSVQVANPQNGAAWANAYQFTVDTNLPPTVAIQQANAQPVTADEQYIWGNVSSWNIGGIATDSDGTVARVDVTCAGQSCAATNGAGLNGDRWSYQQDALEGRNRINVQATDNLGAASQSGNVANITLWVDQHPPQTGLVLNNSANPSDWPAWFTDPVVVHLAASDEGSGSGANLARAGVQEIRYQLNGGEWQSQSGNQLYLELASSGLHTLRYYAVDTVGNTETERSRQIAIDLAPPPAIGTATEQGGTTNDQWQGTHEVPLFTWPAVADEHSGLWGYQLYFGEDATGEGYHTVAASDLRQWQPQSTGVTTGVYYLRGRARDLAGNWSDWSTLFTFRFDNTPPANPERADHAAGVKSTVWQRITSNADFTWPAAVDAGSGLQGYALYWGSDANGESNSVVASNSYQQAAPLCSTGQTCTGYLRLQARDQIGNAAPSWSTAFVLRYDDTPPTLDFNINGGATTANSSQVTLFINGQDSGSGPAQMRFSEDGVTWVTNWITYTTTQPWVINGISGQTTTVHLQVRDGVGLESPVISRSILFDSNIPAPQSANFTLFNSTFAAGSGEQNSVAYWLHSTVAEPPDSAPLVSSNYLLLDGYEAGGVAPPAPTPTPTPPAQPTCNAAPIRINDGAVFTGSRQVTLRFCANGATAMQVSDNAGFSGAQWEPYAETKNISLAAPVAPVAPLYAYVRFRLADGTEQGAFADAIYFDATQPAPPQIYIGDPVAGIPSAMTIRSAAANAGGSTAVLIGPNDLVGGVTYRDNQSDAMLVQAAGVENGPVIDVYLENQDDMAGIGAVQISENADFASAEWQAIPSNNVVNWALSANDGEKTLYARVQDKAGNISNADSADFTLDLTPPLGGIAVNPYVVGVNTDAVTIYLTAYDNQTGVTAMRISTDPLLLYGDVWRPYTTSLTIPAYLPLAGELSLYVQFRDDVGNVSDVYSDTYQVDVEAPQITVEVDPGETPTRLLHIYGYDALSELAAMRLSNDLATLAETAPIAYTTDLNWTFDDRRVVWVQVEDSLGNSTEPIAAYGADAIEMNNAIYLPVVHR